MGFEYGDASNIAVRVFLNQISKKFKYFDKCFELETLKYFDYKCPYTGELLSKDNNPERDHIIPFNKEHCGLHVYGNILIVARKANQKKHNYTIEEFLKDKPERLIKIKNFMQESGFIDIYNSYNVQLKQYCTKLYDQVRTSIEGDLSDFLSQSNIPNSKLILKKPSIKYESKLLKLSNLSNTPEIKIGELVRQTFIGLSDKRKLTDTMVRQLQNLEYCKSTFDLNYPVLKLIDFTSDLIIQRKINGHSRYWAKPYYDNKYFICNDWYERNRYGFDRWLKSINS